MIMLGRAIMSQLQAGHFSTSILNCAASTAGSVWMMRLASIQLSTALMKKVTERRRVPVEEEALEGGFVPTLPQARLQALNIDRFAGGIRRTACG